ncbi:MAG: hypothetical protein Q8930_17070 [Bacillota bacterium]|nr:hypothetical protein [Bacillota bacterium]
MRTKKVCTGLLVLMFLLNINYTVYGIQPGSTGGHNDRVIRLLKDRLHVSDSEIEKARAEGKTAFDLARARGMKEEELRECIIYDAAKAIDNLSSSGIMPKFLTDMIKSKARAKIQVWDGKL